MCTFLGAPLEQLPHADGAYLLWEVRDAGSACARSARQKGVGFVAVTSGRRWIECGYAAAVTDAGQLGQLEVPELANGATVHLVRMSCKGDGIKYLSNRDLVSPLAPDTRKRIHRVLRRTIRRKRGRDCWRVVKMAEWKRDKTPKEAPAQRRDWRAKGPTRLAKACFLVETRTAVRVSVFLSGWAFLLSNYCTDGTHG